MLPERKTLPHGIPSWVASGADYFITICTTPRGENQLCVAEQARKLKESLDFRQARGELWVHLLLFMPDHLHALISFSEQIGMKKSIADWKRYTSVQLGIGWQRDFFDHRLRKNEAYLEKAAYIRMNPVRAGLVASAEDWPYVWEQGR